MLPDFNIAIVYSNPNSVVPELQFLWVHLKFQQDEHTPKLIKNCQEKNLSKIKKSLPGIENSPNTYSPAYGSFILQYIRISN